MPQSTRKPTKLLTRRERGAFKLFNDGKTIPEVARDLGIAWGVAKRIANKYRQAGGKIRDGRKPVPPHDPTAKKPRIAVRKRTPKVEKPLAPIHADGSTGWLPPQPDTNGVRVVDFGEDVLFKIPKALKLEEVFASVAKGYYKLGVHTPPTKTLHAAAPNMLAVLESVAALCDVGDADFDLDHLEKRVRAVIKEARGQ